MGLNSDPREDNWADTSAELPQLEREAIDWVVRLTSGTATAADRAAFESWRAQSSAHEAAASAARQLWIGVGESLNDSRAAAEQEAVTKRRVFRPRILAMAASLLLAVAFGFQALHNWQHDHVAAAGERDQFQLTDGTEVTLNSASALDVEFSAATRRVVLARGEAYFDVAHDSSHPFVVQAGQSEVWVLGTAFSVRRDEKNDGVLVTVERGRVQVRSAERSVQLTVNERVRYSSGALQNVEAANAQAQLAWRRGRLIVEDQPLGEVVDELNRYYSGLIIVRGEAVAARRLNAVIDLEHIDQWLAALDESQPVEIRRVGPVTILR